VRYVITAVVVAGALKLLVWWIEPAMMFYPIHGVQETPAVARLAFTDVRIPTADGETLHGWWLEDPAPRAQVLFWHGNGGNLSLWLDIIAELRRRGFSVLAVDYRGYGASTGKPSERGLYKDADATLRLFAEKLRKPDAPVIYWGRSVGAPIAAYAASKTPPDGVLLETPFPDIRTVLRSNPVLWVLSWFSSYRFPTSKHLDTYRGPLLVVHGDRDSIVPFSAGKKVFERARSERKSFVTIPSADHNDLHVVDPRAYWRSIDEFVATLAPVR
jgi:uncharacterized protein